MPQDEFAAAARAIDEATDDIAQRVARLLRDTAKYKRVTPDYVHERLLIASLRRHPEILDWLPIAWRSQYADQFSASSLVTPGE